MGRFRYLPVILAVLSIIGNIVINNYWGTDAQYVLCITIGLLVIQIAVNEIELHNLKNLSPNIIVKDFGFEIDRMFTGTDYALLSYINFVNEPKSNHHQVSNADEVIATFTWRYKGKEIETNNGRWFFEKEYAQRGNDLLTVNLRANGIPQKTHFMYSVSQEAPIEAFIRNGDNSSTAKPLALYDEYDIEVTLTDNKSSRTNFYFRIKRNDVYGTPIKNYISLEHLASKNGKVLKAKNYSLNELYEFQKKHPVTHRSSYIG